MIKFTYLKTAKLLTIELAFAVIKTVEEAKLKELKQQ